MRSTDEMVWNESGGVWYKETLYQIGDDKELLMLRLYDEDLEYMGEAQFQIVPDIILVSGINLLPQYQRKGHGTDLIEYVLRETEWAKDQSKPRTLEYSDTVTEAGEAFIRSFDSEDERLNWNTLLNTMNYGIVGEYLTWLQENWEDLTNIDDHYYWRAKMNPGEKEMSKHANRSGNWLPQRIRDQKETLVRAMFLYLEKREAHSGDLTTPQKSCFQCGVTTQEIDEYVTDFKERMDYENKNDRYDDRVAYNKYAEIIANEMASDYSNQIHIAANPYLPEYKSQYLGYSFNWDLCAACLSKTTLKMNSIISKDLNRV